MKIKVSETTNTQLDWLVAKCEGRDIRPGRWRGKFSSNGGIWKPTTDWSQGGPIIEREKIEITAWGLEQWRARSNWSETYKTWVHVTMFETFAPTPLIAAMRCFVASRLGDEVEIPEELK